VVSVGDGDLDAWPPSSAAVTRTAAPDSVTMPPPGGDTSDHSIAWPPGQLSSVPSSTSSFARAPQGSSRFVIGLAECHLEQRDRRSMDRGPAIPGLASVTMSG